MRNLVYGVEFSDNEAYLFFSCNDASNTTLNEKEIYRVDLNTSVSTLFHTSSEIVPNSSYTNLGALQLNPDRNKIFIAKGRTQFLDAIDNPNLGGTYIVDDTPLGAGSMCFFGLPSFVSGKIARCKPLDMVNCQNSVPDLFSNTVKLEIVTDGFSGFDKEYDDVDNDGDVDILFAKSNILYYLENNAGYFTDPSYPNPSISLNIANCYSFRLHDWGNDGGNDLIIHGSPTGINGVFLYLYNSVTGFQSSPTKLLDGTIDYPFGSQQLIEVGDLNNDNLPDILLSNQGSISGTAYFENISAGFILPAPQSYSGTQITNAFIREDGGSYPCPELYDADCGNGVDLLMSDPLTGPSLPTNPTYFYGGARVKFYENLGGVTSGSNPNFSTVGLVNQFGFNDVNNNDLRCDWAITRIVDFYNDNCPIAISYNPCNQEIYFYYQQNCICSDQNFVVSTEEFEKEEIVINIFPNPTSDFLNISTGGDITIQSFNIYALDGRLMITERYLNQEINVSDLNTGIYLLNIQTSRGIISKKIVIE